MPKAKTKRTSRRFYRTRRGQKKIQQWLPYIYLGGLILAGIIFIWLGNSTNNQPTAPIPSAPQQPSGPYILSGKPSIDTNFINRVLQQYQSPARGKGQALYELGVTYHIDPAYALAFFLEESKFGTQGVARVTHSLGNIRATKGYASYHGYRAYKTWEAGFKDWYQLIAGQYIGKWGLKTVDAIIPVYAPGSDDNNEEVYIHTVKTAVDTWRQGNIIV